MRLLDAQPTNVRAFRSWCRSAIASIDLDDDSRTARQEAAKLVNHAKLLAYQVGNVQLANVLPWRALKSPVDAALRLGEAIAHFDRLPDGP